MKSHNFMIIAGVYLAIGVGYYLLSPAGKLSGPVSIVVWPLGVLGINTYLGA